MIKIVIVGALALILVGYRWWWQEQQLLASTTRLQKLIGEAELVCRDMEAMLNSAVDISRNIVDSFDTHRPSFENESTSPAPTLLVSPPTDHIALFYQDLFAEPGPDRPPQVANQETSAPSQDSCAAEEVHDYNDYQIYRQMHPTLAVHQLHQRGHSPKEISRILQQGEGEIELILNLDGQKKVNQACAKV